MKVLPLARRPIGYFVHHQGRGHAERAAAILNALPPSRPATVFCARPDIFPALAPQVEVRTIPSLFEKDGDEGVGLDHVPTPDTLHCAPLGWGGPRRAVAEIARWFAEADPALFVTDVSAELAQLARIASVPHVTVLQNGERTDPGHMAAYEGALGAIAPFDRSLAEPDWPDWLTAKTVFAGGLGARPIPDRATARRALGLPETPQIVLAITGQGGGGISSAPLGVGARAMPDTQWITIGQVSTDWHATEPANLRHIGWTDRAADWIGAADLIVASTGNTATQEILSAAKPWIAVPEWRYFDEQVRKAEALQRAGLALHLPAMPASAAAWRRAVAAVRATHDPARQRAAVTADPAGEVARWLERLASWHRPSDARPPTEEAQNGTIRLRPDHRPRPPLAS